ncbi:uncharacterized protein LAESUDRAFT_749684 [Laetiporus sulphureus 93-53]|uniref:Uncharacterized protein n=1 Tax=Laetiporus sulphureus 93-53 TaxID=1314785 RepID=A0A165EHH1_9APHY|nr:uncharacterized protein LAESUDRAFT_749684 [Laetiporus sulphureus 93-53]KZT07062.1 hypothetical protein LAESUDRAFT_749684 [Laetiporus sulphureus 93-53]
MHIVRSAFSCAPFTQKGSVFHTAAACGSCLHYGQAKGARQVVNDPLLIANRTSLAGSEHQLLINLARVDRASTADAKAPRCDALSPTIVDEGGWISINKDPTVNVHIATRPFLSSFLAGHSTAFDCVSGQSLDLRLYHHVFTGTQASGYARSPTLD